MNIEEEVEARGKPRFEDLLALLVALGHTYGEIEHEDHGEWPEDRGEWYPGPSEWPIEEDRWRDEPPEAARRRGESPWNRPTPMWPLSRRDVQHGWPSMPVGPAYYPEPRGEATERLAWYRPFHRDQRAWGIYVRETKLVEYANRIYDRLRANGYDALSLQQCRWLWLDKLCFHEYFHHLVEAALARVGVSRRMPLYRQSRIETRRARRAGRCAEETLANAYAFERLERHQTPRIRWAEHGAALSVVADLMRCQPASYREFELAFHPLARNAYRAAMAGTCLPGAPADIVDEFVAELERKQSPFRRSVSRVPLYLVDLV